MMTITANTQLPNSLPQNRESDFSHNDGLMPTLGSELVYIQDGAGRYLTFHWQQGELLGVNPEKILLNRNEGDTFEPVDRDAYLEQVRRIISNLVPERIQCWFSHHQELFELDLVIAPIMPRLGSAATKVIVTGRLLQTKTNTKDPNRTTNTSSQPELVLRLQRYQKVVYKITNSIQRTFDLDIIWQQIVDSLGKELKLDRCIICPYQPPSTKVRVVAEHRQSHTSSMLGSEIDIVSEPAFAEALATLVPVVTEVRQQKILVIATYREKNQPNALLALNLADKCYPLTQEEMELVKEVAAELGAAIAHATLYKELEAARKEAEAASQLKSEFLTIVSDEIRTPLNKIIGPLDIILAGMADSIEEQNYFLLEARQSSIHLLNIINDILAMSKIESGKMALDCVPVNLHELFKHVENFMRPQAELKKLSFQIRLPATSDEIIVQGNYQQLLQVLINLVGNAIKFTDEGGVTISADLVFNKSKENLPKQQFPGTVRVRVADTGIGVSLDKQDKLFRSFSQVDGSRTRHYGGAGLGLVISQQLVEAMGGEVKFYSLGEGLGSTVTFTVPLYQKPLVFSPRKSS